MNKKLIKEVIIEKVNDFVDDYRDGPNDSGLISNKSFEFSELTIYLDIYYSIKTTPDSYDSPGYETRKIVIQNIEIFDEDGNQVEFKEKLEKLEIDA